FAPRLPMATNIYTGSTPRLLTNKARQSQSFAAKYISEKSVPHWNARRLNWPLSSRRTIAFHGVCPIHLVLDRRRFYAATSGFENFQLHPCELLSQQLYCYYSNPVLQVTLYRRMKWLTNNTRPSNKKWKPS